MISGKINCSKIDKTKLFKGEKGTYLDVALIETKDDQYGNDYMIVQDLGKEARERGEKGAILGNAKIRGPKPAAQQSAPPQSQSNKAATAKGEEDFDSVPF